MKSTNLKVCSLQWGLVSPAESIWTPESPRALQLRSSCINEIANCRDLFTVSHDIWLSLHPSSLQDRMAKHTFYNTHPFIKLQTLKHKKYIYMIKAQISFVNTNMKYFARNSEYAHTNTRCIALYKLTLPKWNKHPNLSDVNCCLFVTKNRI